MNKLADSTALLLTGLVAATFAWGFWYVTGAFGFDVLGAVTIIYLAFENRRLRRRLQQLSAK
jgi:hypothetical protein